RDRDVDPDHPDVHPGRKFARGMAVARENGDTVAVGVFAWQPKRFLETVGANNLQHRPEDFLLVGAKMRLHMVEQGWADEEALLVALQREPASIDYQLAALV